MNADWKWLVVGSDPSGCWADEVGQSAMKGDQPTGGRFCALYLPHS